MFFLLWVGPATCIKKRWKRCGRSVSNQKIISPTATLVFPSRLSRPWGPWMACPWGHRFHVLEWRHRRLGPARGRGTWNTDAVMQIAQHSGYITQGSLVGRLRICELLFTEEKVAESIWDPEQSIFEDVSQKSCVLKLNFSGSPAGSVWTGRLRRVCFMGGSWSNGCSTGGSNWRIVIFRSILVLALFEEVSENSCIFRSWPFPAVALVVRAVFCALIVTYTYAAAQAVLFVTGAVFAALLVHGYKTVAGTVFCGAGSGPVFWSSFAALPFAFRCLPCVNFLTCAALWGCFLFVCIWKTKSQVSSALYGSRVHTALMFSHRENRESRQQMVLTNTPGHITLYTLCWTRGRKQSCLWLLNSFCGFHCLLWP